MKKITFLLYFIGAFSLLSHAQRPEYNDLVVYFADGDFEKLLKVAEKYTTKDDCRKDALPYLYLSKANLEISKGGELLEKYPRAFKDAIKYAGKCLKYDKDGDVFNSNLAHFTACKAGIFEQMRNLTEADDFGRLSGVIPLMEKMDKNDVGTAYLKAVAKYRRGDKGGFKTEEKVAEEKMKMLDPDSFKINEYDDVDVIKQKKVNRELFVFCVVQYAKVVVEKGEKTKATKLINQIAPWFEEDEKMMKQLKPFIS